MHRRLNSTSLLTVKGIDDHLPGLERPKIPIMAIVRKVGSSQNLSPMRGSAPPQQQQQRSNSLQVNGHGPSASRSMSRPTSRSNMNAAFSASVLSSDGATSSLTRPPASPTKERMRQMGFRADGVGGNHFKQKGDEETNIQVVVRIRGMAPGEAPPVQPILSTSSPHCASLTIAMEAPIVSSSSTMAAATATSVQSSLVNEAPANRDKTYSFDHVFAPEADQGMLYQSVVVPVLNEVLSGYNCTIFAYGQTGTGKTHTMEGDLTSNMGTYSPEAGIIPRTLYRLFHTLDLSRDEYSVHASFVELYNEELRDLLSHEAPQPLGGGSNNSGLRMYEDPKGKGVVIQGLEDTPMRDAEHGLALLRKGSHKRQIAATKCNESSSRSHSVFTLTINIKETTSKGEDVMRTGKLNLVDLAGSENIGRSGAENKRAREAGMINQSLLTLGRVINALVEKSTHVPYRESKLTRLLQESLGGRTKTCIIATVSSERDNMEETLSTLDYALRAKSIRNRPEVNQRMTRAALIKEYVHEIERLKGDLLASREKNGIYLSPESWTLMQDEHDAVKAQVEELRRNGEVTESKMISVQEQFEQNVQQLLKRENENKSIKADCKEKEEEMAAMMAKMDEYRRAEAEERHLREAYMRSEKKLSTVASELRSVVDVSVNDATALHAKLERKTRVERKNRDIVAECQANTTSMSNQLGTKLVDFATTQEQFIADLSSQLQEFQKREGDKLRGNREYVQQKLDELQSLDRQSGDEHKQNKKTVDGLVDDIRRKGEALVMAAEDRNEELRHICQRLTVRVMQSSREAVAVVKQSLEELAETHLASLKASRDALTQDRKGLEEVLSMTQEAMQKEMNKVNAQNQRLQALVEEEREKSNVMREKLVKNVSQMLLSFTEERLHNMQATCSELQQGNETNREQVGSYARTHATKMEALIESNKTSRDAVKEKEKGAKAQRMRLETNMMQGSAQLETEMLNLSTEVCSGSQGALQDLSETMKDIHGSSTRIRDMAEAARQGQEKQAATLMASAQEGLGSLDAELQSTLEDVQETYEGVVETVQDHTSLASNFWHESGTQLATIRETTRDYLGNRMAVDVSTGGTPEKRVYQQIDAQWKLVPANRRKALEQERKRKAHEEIGSDAASIAFTDESDRESVDGNDHYTSDCDEMKQWRSGKDLLSGDEEDSGDKTLTRSRPTVVENRKQPTVRASTTNLPSASTTSSAAAALREVNGNRMSLAVGKTGMATKSKMRQPTAIPLNLTGAHKPPPTKRARQ